MGRTYEETGLVRAHAKYVRASARTARLVLDHIRGLSVRDADTLLRFSTRAASRDVQKVLRSAAANAVANHGLDEASLVVAEAFADESVTIKRWQPRARGRAMRIRKRTTHITILLKAVEGAAPAVAEVAPVEVVEEAAPKPRRARAKKAPEVTAAVEAEPEAAAAVEAEPEPVVESSASADDKESKEA